MQSHWKSYQKDPNPENSSRTTTHHHHHHHHHYHEQGGTVWKKPFAACKRCVKSGLEASASPPGCKKPIGRSHHEMTDKLPQKKTLIQKKNRLKLMNFWFFSLSMVNRFSRISSTIFVEHLPRMFQLSLLNPGYFWQPSQKLPSPQNKEHLKDLRQHLKASHWYEASWGPSSKWEGHLLILPTILPT